MALEPVDRTSLDAAVLDLKLVSDILMQLNIVRKNARIYPPGHPQLNASVRRVADLLNEHFSYTPELAFAVTSDSLILGDQELAKSNPIFVEFAEHLHAKSIFSLALKSGITAEEILSLNRVLAGDFIPEREGEPLPDVLSRMGVTHAEVGIMDWSGMTYTDSVEVDGTRGTGRGGGASWEGYVRGLLENGAEQALTEDEDGIELTNVDPKMLAEFLNQLDNRRDANLSYDKVIASYVREMDDGLTHASRIKDTQVRADFVDLVNRLNPELRQELLSERFSFSTRSADASTDVLNLAPAKIILKVLEEVNQKGERINHGVFQLVDMLAQSGQAMKHQESESWDMAPEDQWRFADDTLSFFSGATLDRRAVSREERPLLAQARQRLISIQGSGDAPEPVSGDGLSGLEEAYTLRLLDLLEHEIEEEKAAVMARSLARLFASRVAEGRWETAVHLWGRLCALEEPVPERASFLPDLCGKVKMQFWEPDNISRISAAILQKGLRQAGDLAAILRESCQQSAREMVEALAAEPDERVQEILIGLVADLSAFTLDHVLGFLSNESPMVVANMLRVLQKSRDYSAMKQVAALVEHADTGVVLEAIRTMALMGSAFAPDVVVRHLDHPDKRLSLGAIAIAGQIYDPRIIEGLLSVVRIPSWRPGDFDLERRKKAVAALAAIGSSEALPGLYKIATARKIFHAREFELLKVEIFRSLTSYDTSKVTAFLEWGKGCGVMEIESICKGLAARAGLPGSRK